MIDEILVHISTSATRQNDDLYRSIADAYLEFEPYTSDEGSAYQVDNITACNRGLQDHAAAEGPIFSTSKDSFGSFPSHLSSGSKRDGDEYTDAALGAPLDNGFISTSSRLARLDRIHKHWKQTTPRSRLSTGDPRVGRDSSLPEDAETTFIEDTQQAAQALQSQLQETCSTTSEDMSQEEAARVYQAGHDQPASEHQEEVAIDILGPPSPPPLTAIATPSTFNGIQSTNSKPDDTPNMSQFVIHKSAHIPAPVGSNISVEIMDFSKLPIDAFPPAAKISVERPGKLPSQVTKHLAAIKAQNPKRFRYKNKLYTPKYDDRGYWSVDCSGWAAITQQEFWSSLCQGVLSGKLGWGTTLHRDALSPQALGLVRFYCWAEVAEHMWLLMWLCSKGKIIGSGPKWIDAEGAAVFEVS